jgi:hypothetical protein
MCPHHWASFRAGLPGHIEAVADLRFGDLVVSGDRPGRRSPCGTLACNSSVGCVAKRRAPVQVDAPPSSSGLTAKHDVENIAMLLERAVVLSVKMEFRATTKLQPTRRD